jgi:hypothetical protein
MIRVLQAQSSIFETEDECEQVDVIQSLGSVRQRSHFHRRLISLTANLRMTLEVRDPDVSRVFWRAEKQLVGGER